jgi:hypothetical protein
VPRPSVARDVPPAAHGLALEGVDRVVDPADNLGDPAEAVAQDSLDAPLKGGRTDRAGAAGTLELHLDDAGRHVGRHEHQVAAVGLDGRPHEVDEGGEGGEPGRPVLVGQRRGRLLPGVGCVALPLALGSYSLVHGASLTLGFSSPPHSAVRGWSTEQHRYSALTSAPSGHATVRARDDDAMTRGNEHGRFPLPTVARVISHVTVWCAVVLPTAVVLSRGWLPTSDDAAIAARSRQVLTLHPPLVGYTTTTAHLSTLPLHDPGPMLFWLLSIPVRIDPAHGALWGAALMGGIVLSVAVEAGWSTGRWMACLLTAFAIVDYLWLVPAAMENLTLNVYFPIPFLIASIALAWVVASSSLTWWPVLIAVASVAAQSHLIYAPTVLALVIVAPCVGLAQRGWPERRRWLGWGLLVALVCWLEPLIQNFGANGNLSALAHSGHGERVEGLAFGLRIVASVGAPPPLWLRHAPTNFLSVGGVVESHPVATGVLVLVALVAISAIAWLKARLALAALSLVALCSAMGVLVAFTLFHTVNVLSIEYAIILLWAVSLLVWSVFVWAVLSVVWVYVSRWTIGGERLDVRAPAIGALAVMVGIVVVGLLGANEFDPITDTNAALGVDSTRISTVVVSADRIERTAPRGPVVVDVSSPDKNYLAGLDDASITDGVAWRLETDGRQVGVVGRPAASMGLDPAPESTVFLLDIHLEKLAAVVWTRCRVVDRGCLADLGRMLADRYG